MGCFGNKDKIRGADYRFAIIMLFHNLKEHCTEDIRDLLHTLVQISHFCYAKSDSRSPKSILRLYNTTFKHAMLCINSLTQQKIITQQKLYGIYFHSLTSHLPQMSRIIAPSSLHTEDEERLFSSVNGISRSTSSRAKESIRDNSIIRLQAEKKMNAHNCTKSLQSKISQLSASVGM